MACGHLAHGKFHRSARTVLPDVFSCRSCLLLIPMSKTEDLLLRPFCRSPDARFWRSFRKRRGPSRQLFEGFLLDPESEVVDQILTSPPAKRRSSDLFFLCKTTRGLLNYSSDNNNFSQTRGGFSYVASLVLGEFGQGRFQLSYPNVGSCDMSPF